MSRAVLAVDLDQTLIYSLRSAGDLSDVDTLWVEHLDGQPLSLMTRSAYVLLAELQARHHVVPVTTRTPEQYGRVQLPAASEWVITCNGGILLHNGQRDAAWDARVAAELAVSTPAEDAWTQVSSVCSEPWVRSARKVERLFVYLVAHDRSSIPADWVEAMEAWAAGNGWRFSLQGRKAYLVPSALSKGAAAIRVADQLDGKLLVAGDSLLDRDLLDAAAFAVRPAHGELHLVGYDRALVTERSGALAADDILRILSEQADL